MSKKIVVLIFLALFLVPAGRLFYGKISAAYLPDGREKSFIVREGDNIFDIAENLEADNIIEHRIFFIVYVFASQKHAILKAGTYLLSSAMSVRDIARIIWEGKTSDVIVTIPEGFTLMQIEKRLQNSAFKNSNLKISQFTIGQWEEDYRFLADMPEGASLEGLLFPDTYRFSYDVRAEDVVLAMLDNFELKLKPEWISETSRQSKNLFQIITMASLLEKEIKTMGDKKIVAGILWKRLEAGIPLQVDATIAYITGKQTTKISKDELTTDSPYNTYKYLGLPLGPINNPGLDSIIAAIYFEKNPYWYYLSAPDGTTIFSKTLDEHNAAKNKYLK